MQFLQDESKSTECSPENSEHFVRVVCLLLSFCSNEKQCYAMIWSEQKTFLLNGKAYIHRSHLFHSLKSGMDVVHSVCFINGSSTMQVKWFGIENGLKEK